MSLILGVHLSRRLYLVSDTRLTTQYPDGRKEYKDDFIKTFTLNKRISAVAAGGVKPALFILEKLKEEITPDSSMADLRVVIDQKLTEIIKEYVNSTGEYGNVALITGGFNPTAKKKIESSRLGEAMSAMVVSKPGTTVQQSIPQYIIDGLGKALTLGEVPKGTEIELDIEDSEMITLTVDLQTGNYEQKVVPCYDSAIFYPRTQTMESIALSGELISEMEFGKREEFGEAILYQDAGRLSTFVTKIAQGYNLHTVGGQIFTIIQTLEGALFPTGGMATIKDGQLVPMGGIYVKDGIVTYELADGTKGTYRHLERMGTEGDLQLLSI